MSIKWTVRPQDQIGFVSIKKNPVLYALDIDIWYKTTNVTAPSKSGLMGAFSGLHQMPRVFFYDSERYAKVLY